MKRFVAALLLAVLVMSMCCTVALATCEFGHRWEKYTSTIEGPIAYSETEHRTITTQWVVCSLCGEIDPRPKSQSIVKAPHDFVETGHYHIPNSNMDRSIKVCSVCKYKLSKMVPCECNN